MPANPLSDHSPSLSNRQQQRGMGANTAPGNPPGASSLQARPVGNDDRQQPTVGHDATYVAGPSQADWQQGPVEAASGPGGSMQGRSMPFKMKGTRVKGKGRTWLLRAVVVSNAAGLESQMVCQTRLSALFVLTLPTAV
jgi:hypothetical protein